MSIPLEAHHKAQSSGIFLSFQAKKTDKAVVFIFWPIMLKLHIYAFEIESFPTTVWLVKVSQRKVVVHTFLWVATGHCLHAGIIKSHNFFVLHDIRVNFHIRTRLIKSFSTIYWSWWCAVIPVLCMGRPNFLFTLNRLFKSLFL